MTRFKKEILKRGFRLEETEPFMPTEDGFQSIIVDSENCNLEYHHTSISTIYHFERSMNFHIVGFENNNN